MAEEKRKSKLWKSKGLNIDLETLENGNPDKDNLRNNMNDLLDELLA